MALFGGERKQRTFLFLSLQKVLTRRHKATPWLCSQYLTKPVLQGPQKHILRFVQGHFFLI